MAKKICQCGKVHSTPAAKTRCFRQRIPNYGVSEKKITQKEVIPQSEIIHTLELRNREVQKVQMSQLDIDRARKNIQADGQERSSKYKNVLWANALKIQERIQSQVEKKTKVQALKILWRTQQALWFIISLYIQKRTALQYSPQIPEDDVQLWEEYYLDTNRVRRVFENTQIRELLRQYHYHCITNEFLLGQAASFGQRFRQLGRLILPLTQTKYKLLLRQQYQFYFALQGNHQNQLLAVMNYLKKKGLQRLFQQQPHFKVNASTKAAARKTINRLAVTAFYYFQGASNVRQIVLFRSIFNWMLRLMCLYHQKRDHLFEYQRRKLEMKKEEEQQRSKLQRKKYNKEDDEICIIVLPSKNKPNNKPKKSSSIQQIKHNRGSRTWLSRQPDKLQTNEQKQLRLAEAEAEALQYKRTLLDLRKQKRRLRKLNPPLQTGNKVVPICQVAIVNDIPLVPRRSQFNLQRCGFKKYL